MALENHRELEAGGRDIDAGFQWEFFCTNCDRRWDSPFQPYRLGQVNGLLTRFAGLISDRLAGAVGGDFSDVGLRRAREKALADAQQLAAARYVECPSCHKAVCHDCTNAQAGVCVTCAGRRQQEAAMHGERAPADTSRAARTECPNCRQQHEGGRFCGACGFDLASTHKSCPACGALAPRQARFCTDCGHGF